MIYAQPYFCVGDLCACQKPKWRGFDVLSAYSLYYIKIFSTLKWEFILALL